MKYNFPFIQPYFPHASDIATDYESIVNSNWFTNFGPYEQRFSKEAGEYIGEGVTATTVANCTLGLDLAVRALFDESKPLVIMPSFTFAAGAEVLISAGYKPVFIDIEYDSWQPSLEQAKEIIAKSSDQIAGILLCNIFGVGNRNIDKWEEVARVNNLPLIIDSAAGFGSMYNSTEKIGARGDCEVFSFHATKPFAIGEGGLISSKSKTLVDEFRSLQNFGFGNDRTVESIGTNAKLQELNCAIALRQIKKFNERLDRRREILSFYKKTLEPAGYKFQSNDEKSTIPFASILTISESQATYVYEKLHANKIEARRYYNPPLHKQKTISDSSSLVRDLKVTDDICSRIVSIPVLENSSQSDLTFIVDTILNKA